MIPVEERPLIFTTIEGDIAHKLDTMFNVKNDFLRVEPGHSLLPRLFVYEGVKIRDMDVYEDDVWMVSFPRTGN